MIFYGFDSCSLFTQIALSTILRLQVELLSIWTLFEELSMSQVAWKKLSSNKGSKDARS